MNFDDARRLRALADYRVIDTPAEEVFDNITRLAAAIFSTPIALVSLVDETRQWFKSNHGLDLTQAPREHAFCEHAIRADETLVVEDTTLDARFLANPLVTSAPFVRFYCGVPIHSSDGHGLGTLCLIDRTPRTISAAERAALEALARQVESELEIRRRMILLEEALAAQQQQQKAKELLASMLIHDLRGPLTSITLLAASIRHPDPQVQLDLEEMQDEADRARRMMTDVLDLCLQGMGSLRLRRLKLDGRRLVGEAVRRLERHGRARGQRLTLDLPTNPCPMDVDPDLAKRVLENLITNAMHHGPANRPIAVALKTEGAVVRIEVRDRGEVIPPEQRGQIFRAFETQTSTSSEHHRSHGLGLSFCRMTIEAHGGTIGVEPGIDGGNCFFVELPQPSSFEP
ncbi:MAG: GAF domain-containing sensor histidine kinase [Archangium sp.]|nr:GAF domain-containing sensor histidine kinase [Archangium sp.]MDP3571336.1 GAF domain-containing sensor histidine kinase [Archangium sp.]